MLRKTEINQQLDIFSSVSNFLKGKTLTMYEDSNAWHNIFRKTVTARIDEDIFAVLYGKTGRPNSSIRVLIAMMILKEAEGMSDEKLFEQCRFNILFSSALGLANVTDTLPTESTYYLFRKTIVEYEKEHGVNLYEKMFAKLTKDQVMEFNVSGKSIRMDSKLIASNIAWLSRYELIHKTLSIHHKFIDTKELPEDVQKRLDELLKNEENKVSYRSTSAELKALSIEFGLLIAEVLKLNQYSTLNSYKTLKRVFEDQYKMADKKIVLKENEEISADSVQSPHDTDCSYRDKGNKNSHNNQKVKGYSVNITETCDGEKLNLITDVAVKAASSSDTDFLQPAIQNTQEILTEKIENSHADGAYNSTENQSFCKENNTKLYLHAIQGAKSRYDLELSLDNTLKIKDLKTGTLIDNTPIIAKNGETKWRAKIGNAYRYFTNKELISCNLRKEIESTPIEILQKRNNVEATIFQLSYHCDKAKTRYRGLAKHKMWATVRSIWINFVRIMNYLVNSTTTTENGGKNMPKNEKSYTHSLFHSLETNIISVFSYFLQILPFTFEALRDDSRKIRFIPS